MPRLRSSISCLAAALLLLIGHVQAAEQGQADHPAKKLIDRAAFLVRTDPEASNRDTQAALELLAKRPDADAKIGELLAKGQGIGTQSATTKAALRFPRKASSSASTSTVASSSAFDTVPTARSTSADRS